MYDASSFWAGFGIAVTGAALTWAIATLHRRLRQTTEARDELAQELRDAGSTFAEYARMHREKDTPEGAAKAEINAAHASRCFLIARQCTQDKA